MSLWNKDRFLQGCWPRSNNLKVGRELFTFLLHCCGGSISLTWLLTSCAAYKEEQTEQAAPAPQNRSPQPVLVLMDHIPGCNLPMLPVGLDTMTSELVSVSPNVTAVPCSVFTAATRTLVLLICLLLVAWSHTEKIAVPGTNWSGFCCFFFNLCQLERN